MEEDLGRSGVERALFGEGSVSQLDAWLGKVVADRLGTGVDQIVFRSGRIDAVYALELTGGRQVALKVHRPPVDVSSVAATVDALAYLYANGYPCPEPLDGPAQVDGQVVTVQSLLTEGTVGDGRDPVTRKAMTASLAEHIDLLQSVPGGSEALAVRLGPSPAWTRYQGGPWPQPHDPAYDFSVTPPGWQWLDEYAQEATTDLLRLVGASRRVIAHADWYAGNLRFAGGRVAAAFDWELFAEQEAVVAGLSSGGYLTDHAPTPDEVQAYLDDYGSVSPFRGQARQAATAAARWMLSFNARCDVSFTNTEPGAGSALRRLLDHKDTYRKL